MEKCALIVPYFGKFPDYFSLFLKSCSYNESFKWIIFTDNKEAYDFPQNVQVFYTKFENIREVFIQKLGKGIKLERPYKLCDYRPTYGYVFQDYIEQYEYWGHCDIDLLFGNLETYVLSLMEQRYDKIFAAGHLTLYRNTDENNQRFKLSYKGKNLFEVYSTEEVNRGFDEDGGNKNNIHNIYREHNFYIYEKDLSFNCSDKYFLFHRSYYNPAIHNWEIQKAKKACYFWNDGKILEISREGLGLYSKEYIYMHFQGRKNMKVLTTGNSTGIWICPEQFLCGEALPNNIREWKKRIISHGGGKEFRMLLFRLKLFLGRKKVTYINRKERRK